MPGDRFQPRTTRTAAVILLTLLGALSVPATASAQPQLGNLLPTPRLSIVSPSGGKAGTTVEVTFVGTDLEGPEALLFSHPGIKATPIIPPAPQGKPDPKDPKKTLPAPPAPPVSKFTVVIAADVPLGNHDVRFVGKQGVSNSRAFVVGDLIEVLEKEPNNDVEQAQKVELNTTINGTINAPTDVDYSQFTGKKGQRVVIRCLGPGMDSKVMPELRLLDGKQKEIAYHRPIPGTDGLLDYTLPEDGDYYVRLCQFTYTQGGPDFFYRLTITTAPWIDVVHPSAIEPGKTTDVTLYGRNLPGGKLDPTAVIEGRQLEKLTVKVTAPSDPLALQRLGFSGHVSPLNGTLDGFEYRIKNDAGFSNSVVLNFASAPVVLDNDKNHTQETAQDVAAPCEIVGRLDQKRARDWYKFTAKKDTVYMIEVFSERLGAPTDMFALVRNGTGKEVVDMIALDDNPDTLSPTRLYTISRDPAPYRFVAPADGPYFIMVGSHFGDSQAGPHHVYRIRISPEKPDFRVLAMPPDTYRPDSLLLYKGGERFLTVFVQRRDNFKGEVTLTVEGLPKDVTCPTQILGGNQKQTNIVFTAAPDAAPLVSGFTIKATATVNGQTVVREVRPASVTWGVQAQQNIPTISRLDRAFVLAVRDLPPWRLKLDIDKATVSHGDKVNVPVKLTRLWPDFKAPVQVQPVPLDLPVGITFGPLTIAPGKDDGILVLNVPANVLPGQYNIVFTSFAPVTYKDATGKPKANTNTVLPSTALALTVLPKQVATLTVSNAAPTIKLGSQGAELIVKVARQFDFAGEFKVELVLPPGTQGLTAAPVTIAPGQNEVKMILIAAPNATVGARPNLTVRAVAVVNGNVPLTHETKINVNVVK